MKKGLKGSDKMRGEGEGEWSMFGGVIRGGFEKARSSTWSQAPENNYFPEPLAGTSLITFRVSDWFLLHSIASPCRTWSHRL